MKAQILLVILVVTLTSGSENHESNLVSTESPQRKGLIDWIISGIVGKPTTSIPIITEDPPEYCPSCQCGLPRTRRRIVGGYETEVLEFPWMALLLYNGRFYCGGSLINDLYVLTAAHCTAGFRKEKMTIRFLEHDRTKFNETKTIERKVAEIIRHLRYNPGTYDNDIALLKLDKRVDLSKAIKRKRSNVDDDDDDEGEVEDEDGLLRPVCLAEPKLSYTNCTTIASGWGTTEEGGSVSDILREVSVLVMSNADCRKTAYGHRITDNMLCAGYDEGGRDACQGDSGGPLHYYHNSSDVYEEVGIVSWGEGCARPGRPGVYTRVNRYLTWIHTNTKNACTCDNP